MDGGAKRSGPPARRGAAPRGATLGVLPVHVDVQLALRSLHAARPPAGRERARRWPRRRGFAMAAMRVLLVLALAAPCAAFYLPGVAPQDFSRDDLVYFKARARSSGRPSAGAPAGPRPCRRAEAQCSPWPRIAGELARLRQVGAAHRVLQPAVLPARQDSEQR